MKWLLSILLSAACVASLAGNESGHGGHPIALDIIQRGHFIVEKLREMPEAPLSKADIDEMEKLIKKTRVDIVAGALTDKFNANVTGRVIPDPKKPGQDMIEVKEPGWIDGVVIKADLLGFVFHEYLWVLGKKDDQFDISRHLRASESEFQNYRERKNLDEPLKLYPADEYGSDVSADGEGNAFVTSLPFYGDKDRERIVVKRYVLGKGWQEPQVVCTENCRDGHQVVAARNGNAAVVWRVKRRELVEVWVNYFEKENGWRGPEKIGEFKPVFYHVFASAAIDAKGNAFVLVDNMTEVTVIHSKEKKWVARKLEGVQTSLGSGGASPFIAAGDGKAIVAGVQGKDVWAKVYTPATGWSEKYAVGTIERDYPAGILSVALNENGEALIVFSEASTNLAEGGEESEIYAKGYSFSTGWRKTISLGKHVLDGGPSELALSDSGQAVLTWTARKGSHFMMRTPSLKWSEVQPVEESHVGFSEGSRVGIDRLGNVRLAWRTGNGLIWSRRVSPSLVVGPSIRVSKALYGKIGSFGLSVGAQGDAFVVWTQEEKKVDHWERHHLWVNRFSR